MRNHRKIKAIREKFKKNEVSYGYGLWCMLLEYLTGADGNEFEHTDAEYELLSGDFSFSAQEIREFVEYCVKIELFFNRNGFISSDSLDERLKPVYKKRGLAKQASEKRKRNESGQYIKESPDKPAVAVTVLPVVPEEITPPAAVTPPTTTGSIPFEEPPPPPVPPVPEFDFRKSMLAYGFDSTLVNDWLIVRKKKKCANTETAFNGFVSQVEKTGKPINEVLRKCVVKSWGGLEAEWILNDASNKNMGTEQKNNESTRTWKRL